MGQCRTYELYIVYLIKSITFLKCGVVIFSYNHQYPNISVLQIINTLVSGKLLCDEFETWECFISIIKSIFISSPQIWFCCHNTVFVNYPNFDMKQNNTNILY